LDRAIFLTFPERPAKLSAEVAVPNRAAAERLGLGQKSFQSLETFAQYAVGGGRLLSEASAHLLLAEALSGLDLAGSAGWAARLLPTLRQILHAGGNRQALSQIGRGQLPLRALQAYLELVHSQGKLDRAELFWEAARVTEPCLELTVWGYPRLGEDQLAFLCAAADTGSALYLPGGPAWEQESAAAHAELERRGWRLAAQREGGQLAPRRAYVFPSLEDEVRWTLREVAALLGQGVEARQIALVSRQAAQLGPLIQAVAAEYAIKVDLDFAVPLGQTPLGSWLSDLISAGEQGWPQGASLQLLQRWPLSGEERLQPARSWQESGGSGPRTEWAARFRELASGLTAPSLSGRHQDAKEAWEEALSHWEELSGEIPAQQALREIRQLLAVESVPFARDPQGVPLHTPLSLLGGSFREVFFLDLCEGRSPPRPREDPNLDSFSRLQLSELGLSLELPQQAERRERLTFLAALPAAEQRLTLSYARLGQPGEQRESPYFAELDLPPEEAPSPAPWSPEERLERELLSGSGGGRPEAEGAQRALRAERERYGREYGRWDGVVGPLELAERSYSVSELNTLLACGFRWMAGRVWNLTEGPQGEEALVGQLVHSALQQLQRRAAAAEDLRKSALEQLEAAFCEAEAEVLPEDPSPFWPATRQALLRRLRRLIGLPDFLGEGDQPVASERSFRGTWQGLSVRGRVDRVDKGPLGLRLIDYKRSPSSVPREDLQLEIYRSVALPVLFPGEALGRAGYLFYWQAGSRDPKQDPEKLSQMQAKLFRRLREGLLYPVENPGCRHCPYSLLCRKGARLQGKQDPACG
jgi:hypothetical protein